jgi:hypothetical protein
MHARIEEESGISTSSITFSKYIKPVHLRSNNQKMAHVTVGFNTRHAANAAIQTGLFIEGKHVDIRKKLTEPRRCLKCQKYGHFIVDCKTDEDTCTRCSGKHRTSTCKETNTANFACSNCTGTSAKGHRAADRNCSAFKTELDKLHNRIPDNKYKYFPTSVPRTWCLLNEAENPIQHEQRTQNPTERHTLHHPRSQHEPSEEWQSTRRGRPLANKLTYQDRHYTPQPRTDTYIPDEGWPARRTQSTLDSYVSHTPARTQPSQGPSNKPPPATNRLQSVTPTSRQSSEAVEYA